MTMLENWWCSISRESSPAAGQAAVLAVSFQQQVRVTRAPGAAPTTRAVLAEKLGLPDAIQALAAAGVQGAEQPRSTGVRT